ncbi:inositol monophosphatase family protein [Aureimonas pseudogalii]|uniref:Myo-inositol-1(Or 4)-monophosphatase n=1 Tax=Aureimonas pseudogalii TaxID=1744844 RepID=A0A7W6EEX6_9HYPH|nr:inositol monophosphatase family protein [Aureimonas pseudogalii]MBB3996599.1 myo-inositol-1(or 4)-monophosphatase [Aureimonas pseudogalii]
MSATPDLAARRDAAAELVAEAAREALAAFARRETIAIDAKRPQDFVSAADREIEALVRRRLAARFPGDAVVGEEEGGEGGDAYWIVDPIDGTSNFLAGSPLWGVSLGYVVDDVPVVGAVAAPVLGELLVAADGLGTLRGGVPFERPQPLADLRLVSIGDSMDDDLDASLALQARLRRGGWVIEAFHSTSVSMLFAALGRFDGHLQPVTTMWDIAGGAAICRELGLGVQIRRSPDGAIGIWCGTPALLEAVGPV